MVPEPVSFGGVFLFVGGYGANPQAAGQMIDGGRDTGWWFGGIAGAG